MKPKLLLRVPEPCHENWDDMTKSEKGKFCASCSKQVIDFTLMTDTQVLDFFKKPAAHTCGRFSSDQLDRALQPAKTEKKTGWKWLMACLSTILILPKGDAQKKGTLTGKVATNCVPQTPATITEEVTLGMIAPIIVPDRIITGTVQDEEGNPIAHASVIIENTKQGKSTNAKGQFSLQPGDPDQAYLLRITALGYASKTVRVLPGQKKPLVIRLNAELMGDVVVIKALPKTTRISGTVTDEKNNPLPAASIKIKGEVPVHWSDRAGKFNMAAQSVSGKLELTIESFGFETEQATINVSDKEIVLNISLKPKIHILPEVIVNSHQPRVCSAIVGAVTLEPVAGKKASPGAAASDQDKKTERTIHRAEGPTVMTIFPNPAPKNSLLRITRNDNDPCLVQLLDNNGTVLKAQAVAATAKQSVILFPLPENMAAGIHYIRLINIRTQKPAVAPLIVQ